MNTLLNEKNLMDLRKRYIKDCGISIDLFASPFFEERLNNLGSTQVKDYFDFLRIIENKFEGNVEAYFAEYNQLKDRIMNDIKGTSKYKEFNSMDMNVFTCKIGNAFPHADIYKPSFHNRTFVSIDMKKANFSSLRHYAPEIFSEAVTWEEFIGKYTDIPHIIHSKYIRQVILGNCNPKRHITYEKYIMDQVLQILLSDFIESEYVVFFSNDEIVFEVKVKDNDDKNWNVLKQDLDIKLKAEFSDISFRIEKFILKKLNGCDGYIKIIDCDKDNNTSINNLDIKCVPTSLFHLALKGILKEPLIENDAMISTQYGPAKLLNIPVIDILE